MFLGCTEAGVVRVSDCLQDAFLVIKALHPFEGPLCAHKLRNSIDALHLDRTSPLRAPLEDNGVVDHRKEGSMYRRSNAFREDSRYRRSQ